MITYLAPQAFELVKSGLELPWSPRKKNRLRTAYLNRKPWFATLLILVFVELGVNPVFCGTKARVLETALPVLKDRSPLPTLDIGGNANSFTQAIEKSVGRYTLPKP